MRLFHINILTILLFMQASILSAAEYFCTNSGMTFLWQNSDYVGVYTSGGTIIKHHPSSIAGNTATLESGFGLTGNTQYYAYSPYNTDNYNKSFTALPVSYLNQTQNGNGNTEHLSAFDFKMASFNTNTGSAEISFTHIGAILHFSWTLPINAKVTSLTLTDNDSQSFITEETMNLISQTTTATTHSKTLTLDIDANMLTKGSVLNAYLMVSPTDLTGKTLTAQLVTSTGKTITTTINGTEILAGHIYPISIGIDKATIASPQSSGAKNMMSGETSVQSAISSVTAYAPNFNIDADHAFTLLYQGDVNKDGKADIKDVTDIIAVLNGLSASTYSPDINNDGNVDIKDLNEAVNIILRK